MKVKFITEKQALFVAWSLGIQNLMIIPVFIAMMYSAVQSESARMQDQYIPSLSDRLLEGTFEILVSPHLLAQKTFRAIWMSSFSHNVFAIFVFNAILTALLLFVSCVLFNVWKYRKRGDKFASENEISAPARN